MTQRRQAMLKRFAGLGRVQLVDLTSVKANPGHQPKRQPAWAFGSREPTCRSSPGRPRAQLRLPAIAATKTRQPLPRLAPAAWGEFFSLAERLFLKEYRSDQRVRVGAQFFRAIRGSSPLQPANPLDADRGCDATIGLTSPATALEILKTLDRAEVPPLKAQRY